MTIQCLTLSFEELRKATGFGKEQLINDIDDGLLKYIKLGKCKINTRRRFYIKEVERYLEAKQEVG